MNIFKKSERKLVCGKKERKKSQLCHLRRLFFDQSSPVHPVSESRGGSLSVTHGRKSSCLILDLFSPKINFFTWRSEDVRKEYFQLVCRCCCQHDYSIPCTTSRSCCIDGHYTLVTIKTPSSKQCQ